MNLRQLKNTPWESEGKKSTEPAFTIEQDGFATVFVSQPLTSPRLEIIKFCDALKEKLLAKWDAGAKEHGSNWQGVDVNKEVASEIADIINYHCIFKAKEKI